MLICGSFPGSAMRFLRKLARKGGVSVPVEVREVCDIEQGDLVEFRVIRVVKSQSASKQPVTTEATA